MLYPLLKSQGIEILPLKSVNLAMFLYKYRSPGGCLFGQYITVDMYLYSTILRHVA